MRTWPVFPRDIPRMCEYELPTSRKVIVWQTYRQTHWHDQNLLYHAASHVINNICQRILGYKSYHWNSVIIHTNTIGISNILTKRIFKYITERTLYIKLLVTAPVDCCFESARLLTLHCTDITLHSNKRRTTKLADMNTTVLGTGFRSACHAAILGDKAWSGVDVNDGYTVKWIKDIRRRRWLCRRAVK